MIKGTVKKLNNQGSTFILALIIITFITTLALAVMSASISNMAMKSVERNSTTTFYTAESVLDEVRAGVGLDSINRLGDSYEYVLTNIIRQDDMGYSYIVDNDSAMLTFKDTYIEKMLHKVTGGTVSFATGAQEVVSLDPAINGKVVEYLNSYIKGYGTGMAKVKSVGGVKAYKDSGMGIKHMLIIQDVIIAYKEKRAGETYFSNVTSNLEIGFPNMNIDFSGTNRLDDFLKYALIADTDIGIKRCSPIINGSIYAGKNITLFPDNSGNVELNIAALSDERINVVCGGDPNGGNIIIQGDDNYTASVNFSKANIWCTNLQTAKFNPNGTDKTKGANINIDSFCQTFIKDDLTSEGVNSVINVEGEYYGYSYDGNANNIHSNSSAIIINGRNTKLNIGTNKMILGGHSFVQVGDAGDYMTGEALSFIGNQEIYLIPSDYLAVGSEDSVSNPMPVAKWEQLKQEAKDNPDVKICAFPSGYFAVPYLADTPYTVRIFKDKVYLYFNFKSTQGSTEFVKRVTQGADAELKEKLDMYTSSIFEGSTVQIADGSSIYTKGALLVTNSKNAAIVDGSSDASVGNVSYANSGAIISDDNFVLTSMDLKNRYNILTHLLADLPWIDTENEGKRYIVNDIDSALWQKKDYLLGGNELHTNNIFDIIIDRSLLKATQYNEGSKTLKYDEGINFTKVAVDGDYTVPSDCLGGIIVASGKVELSHDFTGLIISGKNIELKGSATIKSNEAVVRFLIENEIAFNDTSVEVKTPFREYFRAFKHAATDDGNREQIKVETVDYKDLVNINDWRKYED